MTIEQFKEAYNINSEIDCIEQAIHNLRVESYFLYEGRIKIDISDILNEAKNQIAKRLQERKAQLEKEFEAI